MNDTASRKAFGIQICNTHLCWSCLFLYQASQTESWSLSLLHFKPRTKILGNCNRKKRTKNVQFQIFQYYMITLLFPQFQSDQSSHLCNSIRLLSLTEESYSAKTLAAWVNNSVLGGADRLCGSSVFPHLHRSATSPQRIRYICFGDEGGGWFGWWERI